MDLGTDVLFEESGIETLMERIKTHIFPNTRAEARELYHAGLREHGTLSRQSGESVVSYISRCRRWWTLMRKLDSEIEMSSKMRGELFMDLGGFSYQEKLMLLTITANDSEFDKKADVMILQHATKHQVEIKGRSHRVQ